MSSAHAYGLEEVVAARTRLSLVDGEAGRLIIRGYDVEDVAPRATFEEMAHLLWHGRLPDSAELAETRARLAAMRTLSDATIGLLSRPEVRAMSPVDALLMAIPTLRIGCADNDSNAVGGREPGRLPAGVERAVAAAPTIVGTHWRLKNGHEPVPPRADLSHAEHFLHQMFGIVPEPDHTRSLETYLNTVCDHGLNASTFTARVIVSTRSDVISAVAGGMGALKGPLHGGAPGPALDMVFEIGEAARAEQVISEKLARGERLMGFGHRVYRVRDPRAGVLDQALTPLYQTEHGREFYALARHVESTALSLLARHKPGRSLQTNVEFYTALLLHGVGLPGDLFTPAFAVGRVLGWTAHCIEQIGEDRLIRPESEYAGPTGLKFIPIEARGNSDIPGV